MDSHHTLCRLSVLRGCARGASRPQRNPSLYFKLARAPFLVLLLAALHVAWFAEAMAAPEPAIRAGFNAGILPGNDDGSAGPVSIGFTINFYGQSLNTLYVNNNGNITFDARLAAYRPSPLAGLGRIIIAPFFADVDTGIPPSGSTVSGPVNYGAGTVGGRPAFGVNWPHVGYYDYKTNKLNTFQLILIDRSDVAPGDFDFEFNYSQIQWETGDYSGGVNGLGGTAARVGFATGAATPGTSFEVNGSGVAGALLDNNFTTGLIRYSRNSTVLGRHLFQARNGTVIPAALQFNAPSYSVSEGAGSAQITVTQSGGGNQAVSVAYATGNGTALTPSDYTPASGTLTFAPGVNAQSFTIPITNDRAVEPDETVNLTLSGPSAGAVLGVPATAQLVIVNDDINAAPRANAGPDQIVEQQAPNGASVTLNGAASSDADNDVLSYTWSGPFGAASGVAPVVTLPAGASTVSLVVNDGTVNSAADTVLITVRDTIAPVVNAPVDVTAEATQILTPLAIGSATASDAAGPASITNNAPAGFPLGTTLVTWTATDAAGNTGTATQNVTVRDTTAPLLTAPPDVSAEATAALTPVAIGSASVTEVFAVTLSNNAPASYPLGTTLVVWTATDANGNSSTATQRITVSDSTPPLLNLPAQITAEATLPGGAPVDYHASASDSLDGAVSVLCNPAAASIFALGTTRVACAAHDAAGNTASGEFTVKVVDSTAPLLSAPADISIEAGGPLTAINIGAASATDIFAVTISNNAPDKFPLGTTRVTWTATDTNGNSSTALQTISVHDSTPPDLSLPADITVEAASVTGATVDYRASAIDLVNGSVAVSCTPVDNVFVLGVTQVHCSTADGAGNTASGSFRISVHDTTPPLLAVPADITAEATGVQTVLDIGAASATDIFPVTVTHNAPASFPLGATPVTWKAVDANGNTTTATQTISVTDTTPPALSLPADITAEAAAVTGALVEYSGSAVDLVEGALALSCVPAAASRFPLGVTQVNCSAQDSVGNTATGSFTIRVVDSTPPGLIVPPDLVAEAMGTLTALHTGTATAQDIFPVTVSNNAPTAFPLGATAITWTATDANGNHTQAVQTIVVHDTTAPLLTVPADITAEATATTGAPLHYSTSALDAVDGGVAVICTPASGSSFALGATDVTCRAGDAAGNSASAKFTVRVADTTPPLLTPPADITAEATGTLTQLNIGTASAADIFAVTLTNDAPANFPLGTTVVTWIATDANGNSSSAVQKITVADTTPPVFVYNQTVNSLWPPNHKMVLVATVNDVRDRVTAVPAVQINVSSNQPLNGKGDGDTATDWRAVQNGKRWEIWVRAERAGHKQDRIYTIGVSVVDGAGNTSTAAGKVVVPHDKASPKRKVRTSTHDKLDD